MRSKGKSAKTQVERSCKEKDDEGEGEPKKKERVTLSEASAKTQNPSVSGAKEE